MPTATSSPGCRPGPARRGRRRAAQRLQRQRFTVAGRDRRQRDVGGRRAARSVRPGGARRRCPRANAWLIVTATLHPERRRALGDQLDRERRRARRSRGGGCRRRPRAAGRRRTRRRGDRPGSRSKRAGVETTDEVGAGAARRHRAGPRSRVAQDPGLLGRRRPAHRPAPRAPPVPPAPPPGARAPLSVSTWAWLRTTGGTGAAIVAPSVRVARTAHDRASRGHVARALRPATATGLGTCAGRNGRPDRVASGGRARPRAPATDPHRRHDEQPPHRAVLRSVGPDHAPMRPSRERDVRRRRRRAGNGRTDAAGAAHAPIVPPESAPNTPCADCWRLRARSGHHRVRTRSGDPRPVGRARQRAPLAQPRPPPGTRR